MKTIAITLCNYLNRQKFIVRPYPYCIAFKPINDCLLFTENREFFIKSLTKQIKKDLNINVTIKYKIDIDIMEPFIININH